VVSAPGHFYVAAFASPVRIVTMEMNQRAALGLRDETKKALDEASA
jgi:hypothetical protein